MEANVEVAVRICPVYCTNEEVLSVQPNIYNNTIQLCNSQSYSVNYALPINCTQNILFATAVTPLVNYFFEGCDVSVVTFGQCSTGKSYTLLGPGLNYTLSESEYGIIPRFIREVFSHLSQNNNNSEVHITWTQICGENVQDLLGTGSTECSNISEAFDLLGSGMSNLTAHSSHTLFTITLEQQWVVDGAVQHKISTASFVDLQSCEKLFVMDNNGVTQSIPRDTGLLTLQRCIWALSEPSFCNFNVVPYNHSALTTLLKDSFGGRAKTLLVCCVSPLMSDAMETYYTLQVAMRAQMIKNFVTVNSYTTFDTNDDLFNLQFAASQLFKLVVNAECLFKNLIINNNLSKSQNEQISQWLTLKQECKDCISESSSEPHRSLGRIDEEIEDCSESEGSEIVCEDDSQNLSLNLEKLIDNFYGQTDILVTNTNASKSHTVVKESHSSINSEYHLKGARGRRGSIHSADEFLPLSSDRPVDPEKESLLKTNKKPSASYELKQKILKQVSAEIENCEKQIKELEVTIQMKAKLIDYLQRSKGTKANARDKIKQKYQKLQNDQYQVHSKMLQAKSERNDDMEQKYNVEMCHINQKLQDVEMINAIAEDDVRKIEELENSLSSSKKQLEKLKKYKYKEEKRRVTLENELRQYRKTNKHHSLSKLEVNNSHVVKKRQFCSHDEKADNPNQSNNLRHEINELRKTREFLLEHIYKLDNHSHGRRLLNESEERKLLQCEEAIEAVDTAIEYKNQLMCDCSNDSSSPDEDKVNKTLNEQITRLSRSEIRVLLKKYFEKVIELRSTTKKLEQQILDIELQNESLLDRIQNFGHTLQRVRSETEHRILSLQQQHESKLQMMLRYLTNGEDSGVASRVVERSKQAALAFKVSQGPDKQVDKSSFIARFTSRYARHETVPRQLQAAITPPQAKVTRQKNKLIIQQNTK